MLHCEKPDLKADGFVVPSRKCALQIGGLSGKIKKNLTQGISIGFIKKSFLSSHIKSGKLEVFITVR